MTICTFWLGIQEIRAGVYQFLGADSTNLICSVPTLHKRVFNRDLEVPIPCLELAFCWVAVLESRRPLLERAQPPWNSANSLSCEGERMQFEIPNSELIGTARNAQ